MTVFSHTTAPSFYSYVFKKTPKLLIMGPKTT